MARKVAKLRTRNHKVVLNRSAGGDVGISIFLVLFGLFMFIPMYYAIIQSLKPLDELWMYPPRFYVANPTPQNFSDMFKAMTDSWVPFSRYIFNTVFISVGGTFGNLVCGSLAAYAISKIKFPGRAGLQKMVRLALMFHATVGSVVNFMTMSALHLIDTYWAIIIPACGSTLGMFLMMQFMESSVPDTVLADRFFHLYNERTVQALQLCYLPDSIQRYRTCRCRHGFRSRNDDSSRGGIRYHPEQHYRDDVYFRYERLSRRYI